jgi:hypothetical protein
VMQNMPGKSGGYSPERDEELFQKFMAGFAYLGCAMGLLNVMYDVGRDWRPPHSGYFSLSVFFASVTYPGWAIWTWQRLTVLRRSRAWLLFILPLPALCAVAANHFDRWPILARVIGAVAFITIVVFIFLRPRKDRTSGTSNAVGEPSA